MTSVLAGGISKREDLDVPPQRVSFKDLVEGRTRGTQFVRLMADGRPPRVPERPKEPEVSQEELDRQRLDMLEQETYKRAFAAGEQAGMALGAEKMDRELARVLPQFEAVLRQLDGLPRRIFAGAERFLVETSIVLTRQLLAHELTVNPQGVVDRVKQLLDQSAGRRDVVVRVSPGNAELLHRLGKFASIQIVGDPSVTPGSVRLESDFGSMENDLEQQLAEVESGLRRYLQDRLKGSGCEDMIAAVTDLSTAAKDRGPIAQDFAEKSPALPSPALHSEQRDHIAASAPLGDTATCLASPPSGHAGSAAALPPVAATAVELAATAGSDLIESVTAPEHETGLAASAHETGLAEVEAPEFAVSNAPIVQELATEGVVAEPESISDAVAAAPEGALEKAVEFYNGLTETVEDGGEGVFTAEELSAGFAAADWSQTVVQPAWLSEDLSEEEEEVDLDHDGVS